MHRNCVWSGPAVTYSFARRIWIIPPMTFGEIQPENFPSRYSSERPSFDFHSCSFIDPCNSTVSIHSSSPSKSHVRNSRWNPTIARLVFNITLVLIDKTTTIKSLHVRLTPNLEKKFQSSSRADKSPPVHHEQSQRCVSTGAPAAWETNHPRTKDIFRALGVIPRLSPHTEASTARKGHYLSVYGSVDARRKLYAKNGLMHVRYDSCTYCPSSGARTRLNVFRLARKTHASRQAASRDIALANKWSRGCSAGRIFRVVGVISWF